MHLSFYTTKYEYFIVSLAATLRWDLPRIHSIWGKFNIKMSSYNIEILIIKIRPSYLYNLNSYIGITVSFYTYQNET